MRRSVGYTEKCYRAEGSRRKKRYAQLRNALGGGVSYEFDRGSRNLTFAGTIMKQGTATIIIGSGKCTVESDAR
jgi:hypothetical protein